MRSKALPEFTENGSHPGVFNQVLLIDSHQMPGSSAFRRGWLAQLLFRCLVFAKLVTFRLPTSGVSSKRGVLARLAVGEQRCGVSNWSLHITFALWQQWQLGRAVSVRRAHLPKQARAGP